MIRNLKYDRFGLTENPVGHIILCNERLYEVTGTYFSWTRNVTMLTTRHFDRSVGPDLIAGAVMLVLPDPCDYDDGGETSGPMLSKGETR
jgi:hypothetical protein